MNVVRTAKETARHLLFRFGIKRNITHLKHKNLEQRFADIYQNGLWSDSERDVPLFGIGSTIEATATLREQLPKILRDLSAKVFLDVGCGDFTWMCKVQLPCAYIGVDIVASVIEKNQSLYSSESRSFKVADIVASPAPAADVVLCREVLFHLSFEDGRSLLRNILSSGCSYLLLTSDKASSFNSDIDSGDFRLIDLQRRPFGFPAPLLRITDAAVSEGRFVGLWSADSIRPLLS